METQCQNLILTHCNELLQLLQIFKEFFNGKFGIWKTYPLDFELKEDAGPILSRSYLVPKLYKEKKFKKRLNV